MHDIILDKRVNGRTGLLALVGNPVEHTVSPWLHNTISNILENNNVYIPIKTTEDNLGDCVKGFKAMGFRGFNITVPFKLEIMQYLDIISTEAKLIGAVNTVKNENGKLKGYNTDGIGFVKWFEKRFHTSIAGKKVFIVGAGGSSRAISITCASEGADKVFIANRTEITAENLAAHINKKVSHCAVGMGYGSDETRILFEECDIIINTTSVGMYPDINECPINDDFKFNENQIVCDIIYNPSATVFLRKAFNEGCRNDNGLGMLFWQGILAYSIWNEIELDNIPVDDLYNIFSKEILRKL
jgi:shikimate dehydrogenase